MSFPFRSLPESRGRELEMRQYRNRQPQFREPTHLQTIPPRDRYRALRHDPSYDKVEDEYANGLEQPLDSFDERMLQQPHFDRQSRAAVGQGRLSFKPQSSRSFALASSQLPDLGRTEEAELENSDHRYESFMPAPNRDNGQFTYKPFLPLQESSSDGQLSSSPAFQAGRRHAGSTQMPKHLPQHPYQVDAVHSQQEEFPNLLKIKPDPGIVTAPRPKAYLGAPITQGIQQVPVSALPDRLRTIFPYPIFNAVQSKCFDTVYRTDNNFVLSSPTGSGKTVVLELAICRAISRNSIDKYKIVYQAPTKALCSERQRDWQIKFGPLGLNCIELTGDSESADLRNVQSADVIVTTPEKWDSITRKWKDYERLMQLVHLFLVDEVHLLKEERGATLEVVVSRMKSISANVRFVALSATVPNLSDIAAWLGKNLAEPYEPAVSERFGEEFRPVKLRKHVCGYQSSANDFAFDKHLDGKLPDVVSTYSEGKPIMVFCFTRNSAIATAKILSNWWVTRHTKDRAWKPPTKPLAFQNRDLRECAASGVAFHHAGIDTSDRIKIEKAYLEGELSVICCTSTLAVGVNLPCHLVIIKNTVCFTNNGFHEYSDLETMQMLGRAGRPQFDDDAVAVVMTRQNKVRKYELLVTGQEVLESTLHLGLIEHLNAEIGLGTIHNLSSARKWLASTFLYVRVNQNPAHYKLNGSQKWQSIDEQLDDICSRDITLLRQHGLTAGEEHLHCTDCGHAMAQYYVRFDSMRVFMGLAPKATISEILSAIAQASEYGGIRFRSGEKALYKSINNSPYIRFPIPVNLDSAAHKVSILIQSILGGADISWDGEYGKHKSQYNTEALVVFKQINRLIRCIIDCQIHAGDSVSINNALIVERSVSARVWDDSPIQMKQIEGLGVVGCRKLAHAGIRSLEELECTEAHRIEQLLNRNPPFGLKILDKLKTFPKLRVTLQLQPSSITKTPEGVRVVVKSEIGFFNESPPETFANRAVYVCLLTETSDGRKVHFARLSAKKIGKGQSLMISALLTAPNLSINCHIMCDGIAGTMRTASATPKIAPSMFPPAKLESVGPCEPERPTSNISRRRTPSVLNKTVDEFDDGIDDDELFNVASNNVNFENIDNYINPTDAVTGNKTARNKANKKVSCHKPLQSREQDDREPRQLENGKWACNHPCKNKDACKHLCCKQGMDKPPKKAVSKHTLSQEHHSGHDQSVVAPIKDKRKKAQTQLQVTASKRNSSAFVEEVDLTQQDKRRKTTEAAGGSKDFKGFQKLHKSIQKKDPPSDISLIMHQKPSYCYDLGGAPNLSFLGAQSPSQRQGSILSSDYGDLGLDDLSTDLAKVETHQRNPGTRSIAHATIPGPQDNPHVESLAAFQEADEYGDNDPMMNDMIHGMSDFDDMLESTAIDGKNSEIHDQYQHEDLDLSHLEEIGRPTADDVYDQGLIDLDQNVAESSPAKVPLVPPEKGQSLFLNDTSSSQSPYKESHSARPVSKGRQLEKHKCEVEHHQDEPTEVSRFFDNKMAFIVKTDIENDEEKGKANVKDEPVPDPYSGLEPWLFQEFGDIVEIVD